MAYIYCAGPLFNPPEREEMAAIAAVLEKAGHTTFLPQRDGLEFSKLQPLLIGNGLSSSEANYLLAEAIFTLDVHMVLQETSGMVANLNGRVPDEGMLVEASLAWSNGKPLVLYKSDSRSLIHGNDNPLLRGLGQFEVVANIEAIPAVLEKELKQPSSYQIRAACKLGAAIQELRQKYTSPEKFAGALQLRMRG